MTQQTGITLFEDTKVRIVWDDEQEKFYFSVADIVLLLTDSTDVKQYIKRLRSRDPELNSRWGTICTPTEMVASDGKHYKTQAADHEGIHEPRDFAILTNVLTKAWSRMTTGEYKKYKGLIKQNLRDNMTNIELALNTLAEVATTEYSCQSNPQKAADYLAPAVETQALPAKPKSRRK